MRTLYSNLGKIFSIMGEEELGEFSQKFEEFLFKTGNGIDDYKLLENKEIEDFLQQFNSKYLDMLSYDKTKDEKFYDLHFISVDAIKNLKNRIKLLNKSSKFVSNYSNKSYEQLDALESDLKEGHLDQYSEKYGITNEEEREIINILKYKARSRELVSKISSKNLKRVKEEIKNLMNDKEFNKKSEAEVMKCILNVSSIDYDEFMDPYTLHIDDFLDAFDNREKELENKNLFKQILNKIKVVFSKKTKSLPEGKEERNNAEVYDDNSNMNFVPKVEINFDELGRDGEKGKITEEKGYER